VTEREAKEEVRFSVNGRSVALRCAPEALLCDVLREELSLTGTHVGCREGVCGSCNVLVGGQVVRSCLMLALQAEGQEVQTVEGLALGGRLSAVQQAVMDFGAVQCGFCTSGVLITATALLAGGASPSDAEIVDALAGNICRCTGYSKIVDAVRAASGIARSGTPGN
jgi:aerobic-type carbon monoxide dehydrogenase small subunit (CoxS/CutS family)